MSSDIIFIILTYYPDRQKLTNLIAALSPHKVILVDNTPENQQTFQSIQRTAKKKLASHLTLITNGKNLGYTGGVNCGLRAAMEKDASWVVVLNDDLFLTNDIARTFCQKLYESPIGLAGPYPRFLDQKRWTATTEQNGKSLETPDFLSGSFLAIHREVIQHLGYLYEPYFIFYEEVEYCVRAKKEGFPLVTIPIQGIGHRESSTFIHKSFLHQYYLARNHLLFVERNAPLEVRLYEIVRFPKTLREHFVKKETGSVQGIRDYFLRKFGPHAQSV